MTIAAERIAQGTIARRQHLSGKHGGYLLYLQDNV